MSDHKVFKCDACGNRCEAGEWIYKEPFTFELGEGGERSAFYVVVSLLETGQDLRTNVSQDVCDTCALRLLNEAVDACQKRLQPSVKERVRERDEKRLAEISNDFAAACLSEAVSEGANRLVEHALGGDPAVRKSEPGTGYTVQWIPHREDREDRNPSGGDPEISYQKDKEIARLKKQLEEVTSQKEEWRKLFGDQALDFFDFRSKVGKAGDEYEAGVPLHFALSRAGLSDLAKLARAELDKVSEEHRQRLDKYNQLDAAKLKSELARTKAELERATDLHNLYERRYNEVYRQRDDAEFRAEVATEAAELAWGTVNTWSLEELFEKAELSVHRRNKGKDNTIPF